MYDRRLKTKKQGVTWQQHAQLLKRQDNGGLSSQRSALVIPGLEPEPIVLRYSSIVHQAPTLSAHPHRLAHGRSERLQHRYATQLPNTTHSKSKATHNILGLHG